jgi:hypothetical protein
LVRDENGKKIGSVTIQGGHTMILDATDNPVGSVENGLICYGKSQKAIGTIQMKNVDPAIAGGACLLLLLQ